MKIGYACINYSIQKRGNKTFRLASYSETKFIETVSNNLESLIEMLEYNAKHDSGFFRISSQIIPFASHSVCRFKWQKYFSALFKQASALTAKYNMRISMHPDQFILINSPDVKIYQRSVRELEYHAEVLSLLNQTEASKIQIHVGGVYGDKRAAILRFVERYKKLSSDVKKHLVIENDDRLFDLGDCLEIYEKVGIPIIFDNFHHELLNRKESLQEGLSRAGQTWTEKDGMPMVDYSSASPHGRRGHHAETIDLQHFQTFLEQSKGYDFDILLEIKDKEKSALEAIKIAQNDSRFQTILNGSKQSREALLKAS